MAKKQENIKSDIMWRIGVVFVLFIFFGLAVVAKIVYLNISDKSTLLEKSKQLSYKDLEVIPKRGDIKSINGRLLATTIPYYSIHMDTNTPSITNELFRENIDSLALCLSQLFKDKTASEYTKILRKARKKKKRYFLIHRNVTFPQLKKLQKFPIFRLGKYKGGLIIEGNDKRKKPFNLLASRTIGSISFNASGEKVGHSGLERAYDSYLRGEKGLQVIRRISGGRYMPVEQEVAPINGSEIISNINIKFQDIVEDELQKNLIKHDADFGTVVLMETKTGAIRAIANLKKNEDGTYQERLNYAVGTSIEPGSTFKLASLIVALEDGKVKLNDSVDTRGGKVKYYNKVMKDSHEEGYGIITIQEAFEKSSNVGISKMIYKNYKNDPRAFVERLYNMNLNQKTGIEFKGEGIPLIRYPGDEGWSGLSLPWMSIGYEIKLTPLQILTFYNAVANNGEMLKPLFVHQIKQNDKIIKTFNKEVLNPSICSKSTIENAQKALRGVVERGTAKAIDDKNLPIAGKTGTAQVANKNLGYKTKEGKTYSVSFAGYFPANKPKYSCIVVINNPKKNGYYASQVAAPLFKKIANKIYAFSTQISPNKKSEIKPPYLTGKKDDVFNILQACKINYTDKSNESEWVKTNTKDTLLFVKDKYIAADRIPNVKGLGLKDALFILENKGLKVKVYGKGKVKKQSLPPGQGFNKGERIVLELN